MILLFEFLVMFGESFISVIFNMISESKARVHVLYSSAQWYGVTYKKDKSEVALALESMIESGIYPADL